MELVNRLLDSFLFWAAWIVIPLIMEFVPALGSFFVLIKRKIKLRDSKKPIIYPAISIMIPVYNSQDTLEACIRSIYESNYPNDKMRIFLVNNQGQDNSFEVYKQCQEKYPDLTMQWLNANQGKSRALNLALYNSDGKYIINIDSDGILEKDALRYMVERFEEKRDINCMTGVILIQPELIEAYPKGPSRTFRRLEFLEYAQAFLAGRNYSSELDNIYTVSGAFSAFSKSVLLKSRMYNTETLAEDTHLTLQMRYYQKERIHCSEKSIFLVDPIESVNKLYTQRQRWQRGSLEVSKMFMGDKMKTKHFFSDVIVRTLMYDHTFAFPRMIWYLALICLLFLNYSGRTVIFATGIMFLLYIISGYLYYFAIIGFLSEYKELQRYYKKLWYLIPLMPFYNLGVFFIRFAGIINSINTSGAWKTKNLSQELETMREIVKKDIAHFRGGLSKMRKWANREMDDTK